jgi:predicted metal-dependent hydrolase
MSNSEKYGSSSQSIRVRIIKPTFDASTDHFWFAGNPYLTHMINALSIQFPPGEKNFVKSVKYYDDKIEDPDLKRAIIAFVGQELQHRKMHDDFNAWISSGTAIAETYCKRIADALIWQYEYNLKHKPIQNLAGTVACEHLTAIMSANFLVKPEIFEQMDPQIRALLICHSIEEIEHKSVAFDVYQAVGGSYFRLMMTMLMVTLSFGLATIFLQFRLLWADKQLFNIKALKVFISHFYKKNGFFTGLLKRYLKFYSPNFHPSQQNDQDLLTLWSENLTKILPVRITLDVKYEMGPTKL